MIFVHNVSTQVIFVFIPNIKLMLKFNLFIKKWHSYDNKTLLINQLPKTILINL